MMNKLITNIFALCLLVFANVSFAEPDEFDPYKLVQHVAQDLFKRITAEQQQIKQNPEVLRVIVKEQLAPWINHKYAAAIILGPFYRKVNDEERDAFFDAFYDYLIATYAGILTLYDDQQVIFEPAMETDDKKIVMVKTRVLDEGRPDISIDFKLRRSKSGTWSAYDMVAEGVSVLDSKRAELQNLIRQQGVASVTELLIEKASKPIEVKSIGNS